MRAQASMGPYQPGSTLHKKVTSTVTKTVNCVHAKVDFAPKSPPMMS